MLRYVNRTIVLAPPVNISQKDNKDKIKLNLLTTRQFSSEVTELNYAVINK